VNEVATDIALDNTSVAENAAGAVVGNLSTTDPDAGDTHSYAVSDDRFEVVDGQLKLKDGVSLDHEAGDSISLDVTTTDAGGLSRTETFTISVGDVNEVATDIVLDNASVAENAAGAVVGTLTTTDPDDGDTHSYAVSDDRFEVVDGQLKLKDGISLDHEAGDSISLDVTTTDAGGLSRTETFTIAVGDVNEVATDIALDNASVAENAAGTVVGNLSTTDPDAGDTHSYAVSDDRFEVVDGQLKLKDGISLDHEAGDSISLDITTTDAGGLSRTESFTIAVGDVNEVATDIALDNASVAENAAGAVVGNLSTTDPDDGDTHSYAVSDDRFEVVDGQLKLKDGVSLDHEAGDSISLDVTTTDEGGLSRTETFTIAVGDVNEVATDIALDNASVAENAAGAVVGNLSTTDPDAGDTHSYAVSDDRFEVVDGQLKLKDGVSLDHEAGDSISLDVTTTDAGGISRTETFTIAVGDVNEVATDIALDNTSVAENAAGAVVGNLSTTDPDDGDTHSYAVSDDRFEVVDGQLKLKDGVSLDHEAGDSISLDVTTTDAGGLSRTETFTIAVGDVNEVATDIALDNNTVAENAAGAVVGALTTTDPDDGDTHTYAVSDDRFEVVDGQLKLKDGVSLDHEAGDSISLDVTTTDAGGLSRTETFSIDVGDVNEAPTDIQLTAYTGTQNMTVTGSDVQIGNGGGSSTGNVTLPNSADARLVVNFEFIDNSFEMAVNGQSLTSGTVQLQENLYAAGQSMLNFSDGTAMERAYARRDDGGTRLQVVITEDGVEFFGTRDPSSTVLEPLTLVNGTITLPDLTRGENTVTVINPDDDGLDGLAGSITATYQATGEGVYEDQPGAIVGTLSVTDPDAGDTHTYTVSDTRFEIVDGQLKLKDGVALDHEEGDTVSIEVTATDAGGLSRTETFSIPVLGTNDAPTDIALDNAAVVENAAGAIVGNLTTTDADTGDTHSYTVSDTRFEVVDGQLKLKDGVSLDHEAGSTVSVDITSMDEGGKAYTETFTITVGDVDEVASAPTLSLGSTTRSIFSEDFEGWSGAIVNQTGDHVSVQNGWSSDGLVEIRDEGSGGNGSESGSVHHIELNNDPVNSYQDAPNIARSVDTVDGGTYTVSFDYAPRQGYDATVNRFEVVWDGEVVATISADGTSDTDLNWQSHTITLTGDGNPAEIEFREAGVDTDYGRGMMLDNIQMVETLDGAASGEEGTAIALPDITANLTDLDGSESLAVSVSAIPAGAVLTDGSNSFTASDGNTSVDVSSWNLDTLSVTPPASYTGTMNLGITATSTEGETGDTASVTSSLPVQVVAGAGPETLWSEDFSGLSNGTKDDTGASAWSTDSEQADHGYSSNHGVKEGAYEFSQTTDNQNADDRVRVWRSEEIDISGQTGLTLSFDLAATGGMESSGSHKDFFKAYAVVDGERTELLVQDGAEGMSGTESFELTGIPAGNRVTIEFETKTTDTEEVYSLDNVELVGTEGSDPTSLGSAGTPEDWTPEDVVYTSGSWNSAGNHTDDLLIGNANGTELNGNDGDDEIRGYGGNDTMHGGSGHDTMYGGDGADTIRGNSGNDYMDGGDGADLLDAGSGNDVLLGGAGNDDLRGGDGNDILRGGAGNDDLSGGNGEDLFLFGMGEGSDSADGGYGWTDTIRLENSDGTSIDTSDWTISLDTGSVSSQDDDSMDLSSDATGVITLSDGSEISFEGIERIEW
jgi:hypothetical protein